MSDFHRYRKTLSRWLGFAADFASSATTGSPMGVTTDTPAEPPDKTRNRGKEGDGQDAEGSRGTR